MIVAQSHRFESLFFWPLDEVAMLRDEHAGRMQVLHASGLVAHTTGLAAPRGPLVPVAPGVVVNPAHARAEGDHLVLPGDWRVAGPLPPTQPPAPREEAPLFPGGPLPSQVLYLERQTWVSDLGRHPWTGSPAEQALRERLLDLGRLVHPGAVRRVLRGNLVELRSHERFGLRQAAAARVLAAHFGLRNLREAGSPTDLHRALSRLDLQDWPTELLHAPDDWLQREFHGDLPRLLANLIWQVYRLRAGGAADDEYGRDHRGLFYNPVLLVVARAGLLATWNRALGPEPAAASAKERVWVAMLRMLDRMVMDERLFTFRELGFDPARPDLRHVGDRNPHVVLLAEKGTLRRAVEAMGARFGLSWLILGGQPSAFGTELFAEALLPAVQGRPLQLLAFVDFDPAGWIIAEAFRAQAERFGLSFPQVRHLVRPERFTPQELQRIALPLDDDDPSQATRLRRWMEKSGGVYGQARGIYADSLRPVARVEAAVAEESGLP